MATPDKSETLIALVSFTGRVDGEDRVFLQGEPVRASDPAAKKWPHLFGQQRIYNEPRIEQATAAPGEKR